MKQGEKSVKALEHADDNGQPSFVFFHLNHSFIH